MQALVPDLAPALGPDLDTDFDLDAGLTLDLERGIDLWRTYAHEEQGNSVGVYFDRVNCRSEQYDILKLAD